MSAEELKQLKLDAARWRALINSSALVRNWHNIAMDSHTFPTNNAYLFIELSVKPAAWAVDKKGSLSNKNLLTGFADQAIKNGNHLSSAGETTNAKTR